MAGDEILETLKRIEGRLDEAATVSARQWLYGFGFGAMIASLAVLQYAAWAAPLVFLLGFFLMILSAYYKPRRTTREGKA